ncbi:MAG TPA: polysaccharide deacetylase family protein [Blastocatellia bacterium]|nr:polysaccharide deacetylase family protein [Blastocatellia bacterium]
MVSRQSIKGLVFTLLNLAGVERRLLSRIRREKSLVILNLHQVSTYVNPFYPPLHPQVFEQLLVFLKKHFHLTTFRELENVSSNKPLAILSFDDGYHDFIDYVMPLLDKHRLRANMNVIPSCVESGLPIWNVQLYDFLNSAPRKLINEIEMPGFNECLNGDDNYSKVRYGLKISRFLKNRPRHEREAFWKHLVSVMHKADNIKFTLMMSADEIKEAARLHEIGAHSFSHESMGFEENGFFQDDLQKCAAFFKERLQLPLDIYAFPNGSYRDSQVTTLQQQGIKHVLLVGEKFAHREQPIYPRFTLYGETFQEVKFLALGYKAKREEGDLSNVWNRRFLPVRTWLGQV